MFENLKKEMSLRGVRQKDIAESLGLSEVSVSKKMNGKRDFTLCEIVAIKEVFFPKKSLDYLFLGKGERE